MPTPPSSCPLPGRPGVSLGPCIILCELLPRVRPHSTHSSRDDQDMKEPGCRVRREEDCAAQWERECLGLPRVPPLSEYGPGALLTHLSCVHLRQPETSSPPTSQHAHRHFEQSLWKGASSRPLAKLGHRVWPS